MKLKTNDQNTKPLIVISAVNLRRGGTLTILRDCLNSLSNLVGKGRCRVVALVHKRDLADYPGIEYIEIPWSAQSWIKRLWCEYVTMKGISKQLAPVDLWLSLHDTSPRVNARRQGVYCHNPHPFFPWRFRDIFMNYRIVGFALFSKFFYRYNVKSNNLVVVQQQWLREGLGKLMDVDQSCIAVFPPAEASLRRRSKARREGPYRFLYPSTADIHKNFEHACQAALTLEKRLGKGKFQLIITVAGNENRYARWLKDNWGSVDSIKFAGYMSKVQLEEAYNDSDCLVFPSKVETWGLPISEFKVYGKPMLIADLPYGHETAAGADKVAFFSTRSQTELADYMERLVSGDQSFLKALPAVSYPEPTVPTWEAMFDLLLSQKPKE